MSAIGVAVFFTIGFIAASIIDHGLGIACPDVEKIGVPAWKLLLHKFMYVGLGAGATYLLFS